jgi:hypothetical protein
MFVPRSTSGRWIMLLIVAWLIWVLINHPSEGVEIIQGFFGAIGKLFGSIYDAYQGAQT